MWKEICVSIGVRKPGNMCVTKCHDMTLAVKVALNLNTTNQPSMDYAFVPVHTSAEMRGENMPEGNFASTKFCTPNHQVMHAHH